VFRESCIALLFVGMSVRTSAAIITFEGLQDSAILTTQIPGLTFSNTQILTAGISLNEFEFPPRSGTNVASDNGGPISISFATPVTTFSGYFTYLSPLTLTAFGSANNTLATAHSLFVNNLACLAGPPCSGIPGSSPNELLQVSSATGISRVSIAGNPAGGSFVLDEATIGPEVMNSIPEPGTAAFMLLGGLLFVRFRVASVIHLLRLLFLPIAIAGMLDQIALGQTQLPPARALPPSIAPNAPCTITVFVGFPDDMVIPGSVTLMRLSSNGPPVVVGQLRDDGSTGDAVAGDTVYTIAFTTTEPAAGQITLQVSAAFRGQLRRVISPLLTIPVTSDATLPSDPGLPGTLTLAGIDADHNGVRDDVQRHIAMTYPSSATTRAALTDLANSIQMLIVNAADSQTTASNVMALGHALECSISIHGLTAASDMANTLRAQILNTISRSQAYLAATDSFSGHVYTFAPSPAQQKALCTFNPDVLPN
jgi:hypothetical protein